MLFIDAQNYHTAIDTTHNEWSPWQLKNLSAIVWLYRGELDKYVALLDEYRAEAKRLSKLFGDGDVAETMRTLGGVDEFSICRAAMLEAIEGQKAMAKAYVEGLPKREQKKARLAQAEVTAEMEAAAKVLEEAVWLTDKFGEGEYADVAGLCKIATRAEIEEKNWSLTPGAYVGVPPRGGRRR